VDIKAGKPQQAVGGRYPSTPPPYLFQVLPGFADRHYPRSSVSCFAFSPFLFAFPLSMVVPTKICGIPQTAVDGQTKGPARLLETRQASATGSRQQTTCFHSPK